MNKVNKKACIQLHKLINSGDEKGAINLINSEKDIDVSYEYKCNIPIFSAINSQMYDLFALIVNHPTFNPLVEDGFGESLLESLLYMCTSDESTEDDRVEIKKYIDALLKSDKTDFNYKDLNEDTALSVACEYPQLLWVVEFLASKEEVNVNTINDINFSPLGNAIRRNNLKAIEILAKRKDLQVTVHDLEVADEYGIDLSKYGIEAAIKLEKAHDYACAMAE